jgi:hypothetical protein
MLIIIKYLFNLFNYNTFINKMVKLFQLACFIAICQGGVMQYRRGLVMEGVNSPQINQQQDIEVDEGSFLGGEDGELGFGWGNGAGANTATFNSFNNVGGVSKTTVAPAIGNGWGLFGEGSLLFKRGMDLSHMASPDVAMMQSILEMRQ